MEFKDKDIEAFWNDPAGRIPKRVPSNLRKTLYRKLQMIEAAKDLNDLRVPPGNHLEKLVGDREGQHSIRVSSQWRICFRWTIRGAEGVEFSDYH